MQLILHLYTVNAYISSKVDLMRISIHPNRPVRPVSGGVIKFECAHVSINKRRRWRVTDSREVADGVHGCPIGDLELAKFRRGIFKFINTHPESTCR